MRLSDAIRLGSMMHPQGKGYLRYFGLTCALGAALDAIGLLPKRDHVTAFYEWDTQTPWGWTIREVASSCPQCGAYSFKHIYTITHLNDSHGWTREQIADWVETLEPQETEPLESTPSVAAVARDEVGKVGLPARV